MRQFLPGGKEVLYSITFPYNFDYGQPVVLSLETGQRKVILDGGTKPEILAERSYRFRAGGCNPGSTVRFNQS